MTDALETAQAEIKRLKEALEPFADAWEGCCDGSEEDSWCAWESPMAMAVEYGDFRRAHAALSTSEEGKQ